MNYHQQGNTNILEYIFIFCSPLKPQCNSTDLEYILISTLDQDSSSAVDLNAQKNEVYY